MGKIATYMRVSTDEQNLERQLESTTNYATNRLGADPKDVITFRDKSTGTNTKRDGYMDMMSRVEEGEFDAVVAHSVSRVSRSIRDLDRTVERVVDDSDTELHIISEDFELKPGESNPFQKATLRLLGVFAELEAEMAQQRAREGLAVRQRDEKYAHGPAPLGFRKDEGHLVEGEEYDEVCTVLADVVAGKQSKRKAAEQLDTTRATIRNNIEDRAELYDL
jgi:DNA invertase Pin-like site-specific DNA recombinase